MEIQDFLGIVIVGVALSMAIQFIKIKFGINSLKTKAITILLAVVCGTLFYFGSQTSWWQGVITILGTASAFWAFFLKE